MIRRNNPHHPTDTSGRHMGQKDNPSLDNLFLLMDVNGDGTLTKEEFMNGILDVEHWDITEIEVSRMFDSIDVGKRGYITRSEFNKVIYLLKILMIHPQLGSQSMEMVEISC